jgi:hypothetical protein
MPSRRKNVPRAARRLFGSAKYAAFHLLIARWIRHFAADTDYVYVALGGTELRDFQSVWFVDGSLVSSATSYERDLTRSQLASTIAAQLLAKGATISTIRGDMFDYVRNDDRPHIFFLDLEGSCATADFHVRFGNMFRDETLREDDCLIITSYLGRNVGWQRLLPAFDAEFRALRVSDTEEKKYWYRRAHPSFTLFRGLTRVGLANDLAIQCFGTVEYVDTSKMGLYGYTVNQGNTSLLTLVDHVPHFDMRSGIL